MKKIRVYMGYTSEAPLWGQKNKDLLEESRWVVECLRRWRKEAGVRDGDIYDYPELKEFEAKFVTPDIYSDQPIAYIEMPEDKFLFFKLKYCK